MSLLVDVFVIEESGATRFLDVPPESSDMAGFEIWRTVVWGSEAVRSLGARFLPRLADGDCEVAPDQVQDFLTECALVREKLALIALRMDPARSREHHMYEVGIRLDNFVDAGRRAQQAGGGVLIW
ncbi:hypothetical protein [Actinacidiphila oryziradicis]|uniref:DUF1877 family protein n=1 Tax=Actinacidiphila oryziradicis TaxID=2571141 RepID=A0A4U0SFZ6_9ACTN|nr:hypothetical protein [Actinacidiphila oryziradicis]TKA08352.1 hypothetical protein FCI23_28040 [Actinacidiphila oryziradicis]